MLLVVCDISSCSSREMKFCLLAGGDDGEYNGVRLLEISDIFSMQGAYFLEKKL